MPAKGYFITELRFKIEVDTSAHLWLFALTRALYVPVLSGPLQLFAFSPTHVMQHNSTATHGTSGNHTICLGIATAPDVLAENLAERTVRSLSRCNQVEWLEGT